ncbi:MAG TPA: NAD(P)-dependent oxidoreductase [Candidatus Binataceae bacterium]|nr:NAD(P)-dependent oxidoreductase [Candidatus Binataceae bacterium]
MAGSRVFLTGASGNVGQAVLDELMQRGYDVAALVRSRMPNTKGYRPIIGDLSRIHDIASGLVDITAIIHCASPRSAARQGVINTDIEGTAQLLNAWHTGPFIYTSSQTVYGIPTKTLNEDCPLSAGSWYDLGKICNEQQVSMVAEQSGAGPGVSLRLPLVFATGARRRDRQFLPGVWDALRTGQPILFGSEEALETAGSVFIGEKDLGRAVVDALAITQSGPFNLAGGFTTWKSLLEILSRHGGHQPKYVFRGGAIARPDEFRLPQSRSMYDCSRFTRATGFQPRQPLDEIVAQFIRTEIK